MNNFKINFKLQELEKVCIWGDEHNKSIHWFGLTDGFLWINVGSETIYEYNDYAREYFKRDIKYNDYQIVRFIEDFSDTFRYIGESVPKKLYDNIDVFQIQTNKWKESYVDEPDDVFDGFYFDKYCNLTEWYTDRSFDSIHLIGGPYITLIRYEDKIKILWKSEFLLENGNSIWTSPKGVFEMQYKDFVSEVKSFFESFFIAMDKQVENAMMKDWDDVSLDKEYLIKEHSKRKSEIHQKIGFLENSIDNTDWNKIIQLYNEMQTEI